MIDKINYLLYNIRTGVAVRGNEMQEVLLPDFTKNTLRSHTNFAGYSDNVRDALLAAGEKSKLKFVIAGGFVRDTLLGYEPRDIDVFLLDCEDIEDDAVYFTEVFRRNTKEPYVVKNAFRPKGVNYDKTSGFVTYSSMPYAVAPLMTMDVMGTTKKTPEEVIDSFDYSLVKAYLDPETNKFFVHPSFIESVKKNRIETSSTNAWARADEWRYRTRCKIVVGRPPKKEKAEMLNTTSAPILESPTSAYSMLVKAEQERSMRALNEFFRMQEEQRRQALNPLP